LSLSVRSRLSPEVALPFARLLPLLTSLKTQAGLSPPHGFAKPSLRPGFSPPPLFYDVWPTTVPSPLYRKTLEEFAFPFLITPRAASDGYRSRWNTPHDPNHFASSPKWETLPFLPQYFNELMTWRLFPSPNTSSFGRTHYSSGRSLLVVVHALFPIALPIFV